MKTKNAADGTVNMIDLESAPGNVRSKTEPSRRPEERGVRRDIANPMVFSLNVKYNSPRNEVQVTRTAVKNGANIS
jgi:hypothetical protein